MIVDAWYFFIDTLFIDLRIDESSMNEDNVAWTSITNLLFVNWFQILMIFCF
jgi:hypothetical protein